LLVAPDQDLEFSEDTNSVQQSNIQSSDSSE
jgi:hypothetical protein